MGEGRVPAAGETKAMRTRRRILDAAAHEFAVHGYGGASLRRIAAAADLQVGSLAFHFASKDDLVAAALADGVASAREALESAIAAVPDGAAPRARLLAAVVGHLDALHASDDRAAAVVRMVDTLPPDLRAAHEEHERRFGRVWLDVLDRGRREGVVRADLDRRILRDVVVGALNGTATAGPGAHPDLTAVAEAVVTLLAPPHASSPLEES